MNYLNLQRVNLSLNLYSKLQLLSEALGTSWVSCSRLVVWRVPEGVLEVGSGLGLEMDLQAGLRDWVQLYWVAPGPLLHLEHTRCIASRKTTPSPTPTNR